MVVVTAIAFVAACGLTWFAVERSREQDRAEAKGRVAILAKQQAEAEKAEMAKKLDELKVAMDEQDARLTKATNALIAAQNQADIDQARADIVAANKAKAIAKQKAWELEQERLRRERLTPLDVSKCVGTAVGCLKHK
jgi:hypothetical protein